VPREGDGSRLSGNTILAYRHSLTAPFLLETVTVFSQVCLFHSPRHPSMIYSPSISSFRQDLIDDHQTQRLSIPYLMITSSQNDSAPARGQFSGYAISQRKAISAESKVGNKTRRLYQYTTLLSSPRRHIFEKWRSNTPPRPAGPLSNTW
jgi:hypothetical protein